VETIRALGNQYGNQGTTDRWTNGSRVMVGPRRNWPPPADG
jgi:hypothetical protein